MNPETTTAPAQENPQVDGAATEAAPATDENVEATPATDGTGQVPATE